MKLGIQAFKLRALQRTAATLSVMCLLSFSFASFANAETYTEHLDNTGILTDIDVDIQDEYVPEVGGGIANTGEIGKITGNLELNGTKYFGGGIYNDTDGVIQEINAKLESNFVLFSGDDPYGIYSCAGGGLYNDGYIGKITGDFISNIAMAGESDGDWSAVTGGGIFNNGHIELISGNFATNAAMFGDDTYGYAMGGAIANGLNLAFDVSTPVIDKIESDFTGNLAVIAGGAIYNAGNIGSIDGKFESNISGYMGGAIYNDGHIDTIKGKFVQNKIGSYDTETEGGFAVYADADGGDYPTLYGYGGAVYNTGKIDSIEADFQGNYIDANVAQGAAIGNDNYIRSIKGNFTDNKTLGTSFVGRSEGMGGAIANGTDSGFGVGAQVSLASIEDPSDVDIPTIDSIEGNFNTNRATLSGGAIQNNGYIGSIKGNFNSNRVILYYAEPPVDPDADEPEVELYIIPSQPTYAGGGAISNDGKILTIEGGFNNNFVEAERAYGGAISNNRAYIKEIKGSFNKNYVNATEIGMGGAISNGISFTPLKSGEESDFYNKSIGSINAEFVGNYSTNAGGAIANNGYIGEIKGKFNGNYTNHTDEEEGLAFGGAIFNNETIGSIEAEFDGNYAASPNASAGGAIAQTSGLISDIKGSFKNNSTRGDNSSSIGGAIANGIMLGEEGSVLSLSGIYGDDFVSYAAGSTIGQIQANFENNISKAGGAIINLGLIGDIKGDFIENQAIASSEYAIAGGAIANSGVLGNVEGNFTNNIVNNSDNSALGGAVYLGSDSLVGLRVYSDEAIDPDDFNMENPQEKAKYLLFSKLHSSDKMSKDQLGIVNSTFKNNSAVSNSGEAKGGAVYIGSNVAFGHQTKYTKDSEPETERMARVIDMPNSRDRGIINSSFYNNSAQSQTGIAKGGAIYTKSDLKIAANNGYTSVFDGNYTLSNGEKDQNAIYVDGLSLHLDRGVDAGGDDEVPDSLFLSIDTQTDGKVVLNDKIDGTNYSIGFNGDLSGHTYVNNDITNANSFSVSNTNVTVLNPSLIQNNASISVDSGNLNFTNLENQTYTFAALQNAGNINFNNVKVDLENETMGRLRAETYGSMDTGKMSVNNLTILSDTEKEKVATLFAEPEFAKTVGYIGDSKVLGPKYKYGVSYDVNADDEMGYFNFTRSGSNGDEYNPSVYTAAVSTTSGAYATQNQVFNYAFQHSDNLMNMSNFQRAAYFNSYKYAMADSKDGVFSPLVSSNDIKGIWIKPYTAIESVPIKNGPKVTNIAYGTLLGYDSRLKSYGRGFYGVTTGYIGYTGVSQNYSGIHSYQNGGLLGLTQTLYKGNFFNATTFSAGAAGGYSSNYFGNEDFALLMAGVGNKMGYNLEFSDGKFIIQPHLFLSYSFANTFDYTNAAGVRIQSDPLNTMQISPGLKLIANTKNNWQPYIAANMVWSLFDKSSVQADGIMLPGMSIKPYVQYGLGIQKLVPDRFMLFGQALVENGGRNGVSLSAGVRWLLGHSVE